MLASLIRESSNREPSIAGSTRIDDATIQGSVIQDQ